MINIKSKCQEHFEPAYEKLTKDVVYKMAIVLIMSKTAKQFFLFPIRNRGKRRPQPSSPFLHSLQTFCSNFARVTQVRK